MVCYKEAEYASKTNKRIAVYNCNSNSAICIDFYGHEIEWHFPSVAPGAVSNF